MSNSPDYYYVLDERERAGMVARKGMVMERVGLKDGKKLSLGVKSLKNVLK